MQFARDRRNWVRWLYTARQRYDLCVLVVRDHGRGEIARGIGKSRRWVLQMSGASRTPPTAPVCWENGAPKHEFGLTIHTKR